MEYYEVREIRPKLKRLRELLEENMFSGMECENDEYHQGKKVASLNISLFVNNLIDAFCSGILIIATTGHIFFYSTHLRTF